MSARLDRPRAPSGSAHANNCVACLRVARTRGRSSSLSRSSIATAV
jgi:hypothetical protein